jgi:hypothetical protein
VDFDCNFGDGLCGFVNTGSSDWIEGASSNSSSDGFVAGPSEDSTTGFGTYLYAPAISHYISNQRFALEASLGSSTGMLSFYYNLIGCANSSLSLFTQGASGTWTKKWWSAPTDNSTSHDGSWQNVNLTLMPTELSLKYVAFTPAGAPQSCAVALDDIYVATLCTLCPKGQYQDSIGTNACLPCVNGSYCETEGLAAVAGLCAVGQYSK